MAMRAMRPNVAGAAAATGLIAGPRALVGHRPASVDEIARSRLRWTLCAMSVYTVRT